MLFIGHCLKLFGYILYNDVLQIVVVGTRPCTVVSMLGLSANKINNFAAGSANQEVKLH